MSLREDFERLLMLRGTHGYPIDAAIATTEDCGDLPKEICELLKVQNGEDPLRTLYLSGTFAGFAQIRQSLEMLRQMVEDDETLPEEFLGYVPFLSLVSKSDIGVFRADASIFPGEVVEYHYESGEVIRWGRSLESFMKGLGRNCDPSKDIVNGELPDGVRVFNVWDWESAPWLRAEG
jgi:hypothetical protein